MSYSHAIRITLPFSDCSGVIFKWTDRSKACLVYQHDADEEVSKTHVHLILSGCETKSEALKRMWKEAPGKGNEFWSWKDWDGDEKFITYMSKGTLRPIFVKDFSMDKLERLRQDWADPVKDAKPGSDSERLVCKIVDKVNADFRPRANRVDDGPDEYNVNVGNLFDKCRSVTWKHLWGEKRLAPHATHYKIVASSVFMRICEKYDCFESGLAVLQEKWY